MDMNAFYMMVDRYSAAAPGERADIENQIWERFGVERAVLALDMSGFTLSVRRDGLLPYLSRIRTMQGIATPIVVDHGGEVVRYQADNLMAVFPEACGALSAAHCLRDHLACCTPSLTVGIGLAWGRILLIPGWDSHGDATNVAYKLGEDVSLPGEILASEDFVMALGEHAAARLTRRVAELGELMLEHYSVGV